MNVGLNWWPTPIGNGECVGESGTSPCTTRNIFHNSRTFVDLKNNNSVHQFWPLNANHKELVQSYGYNELHPDSKAVAGRTKF